MSPGDWKTLVDRVLDDVRTTPDERLLAEQLADQCQRSSSPATGETITTLQQILRKIEERGVHHAASPSIGRTGNASLAWKSLTQELITAEKKWAQVANVQFWLGILTVPLVTGAAFWFALGSSKLDFAGSAFLSLLIGAAVTHSFLVLRIHQQARQAEERIVEKRVGLAFLRVALDDYSGEREFDAMIQAGTQMFLGHHAAATIPLSSKDLRGGLSKMDAI